MKFLIALSFLISSATSFAAPVEHFARSYSKAHLRMHPGQSVTKVHLAIIEENRAIDAHIGITLRGRKKVLTASSSCVRSGGKLNCTVDGQKTDFTLSEKNGRMVVRLVADVNFYAPESDDSIMLSPRSDDSVFSLIKVSP
jgi:hypothetical protein